MRTVRPVVIGMLSYGVALLANPDVSPFRTLGISLLIITLMFVDDFWKEAIRVNSNPRLY